MDETSVWVIKGILGLLVGFFGIATAYFTFLDVAKGDKHESTRERFRKKWEAVSNSAWLTMPERIIEWFLQLKTSVAELQKKLVDYSKSNDHLMVFFLLYTLILVVSLILYSYLHNIVTLITVIPACVLLLGLIIFSLKVFEYIDRRVSLVFVYIFASLFILIPLIVVYSIHIALAHTITLTTVYMILMTPACWIFFFLFFKAFNILLDAFGVKSGLRFEEYLGDLMYIIPMSICISFSVTVFSLLIGHTASPDAWIPQTSQMLISNVICDAITLVITIIVLQWAVKKPGVRRILYAILFDCFVALILACCSLYFGLFLTEKALSVSEILYVFIAMSPDGNSLELGPYFWAMHTTFLPTLFYLSILFVAWMGKTLLIFVEWFFGIGRALERPLLLCVALCGLMIPIFVTLVYIVGFFAGVPKPNA